MNSVVVIPNHLPHLDFLSEWEELKQAHLIIIQDIGKKPKLPDGFTGEVYDHSDIEKDLGKDAWIIPTQTSACRSYGYYKAWQKDPKYIFTLDNDCYSEADNYWLSGHISQLESKATLGWVNTVKTPFMRGFPYGIRNSSEVLLNHGLWSNVPDLDGATMLHQPNLRFDRHLTSEVIPRNNYFPMCGMNLAWKRELTPAMYFGLFGKDYGFDQYDDIWAGVIVKKIIDHLGYGVRSGYPSVEHRKQSNAFVNLEKQAPGMRMNEIFSHEIDKIELNEKTVLNCYKELISKLPDEIEYEPDFWTSKFKKASLIWAGLFE
jgi:hypothetical protein